MDKRAGLRQHFQTEADKRSADAQFAQRTAQVDALNRTLVGAFTELIRFMDGKTSKTEVVNQLKSISTPDVDKVVVALSKLDADVLSNKLDLKPLVDAMNGVKRELSLVPKSLPKFEQKETVKVSNLSEVKLDTSAVEKAIKALKLETKVDAPIINVDAPDLSPLKSVMLDMLKAVKDIKLDVPAFPELPVTDLSKVEKKIDESNKHLKAISEKKMGGGGGGGNGTPYTDESGIPKNVVLSNGAVPVEVVNSAAADIQNIEMINALRALLQQIAVPSWFDPTTNTLRVGTTAVTVSSGTVTTVGTVTNLTNFGTNAADVMARDISINTWANTVRSTIS